MTVYNKIQNILGVDIRARCRDKSDENYDPFKNPLIHKRIDGSEIVPLNLSNLWGE